MESVRWGIISTAKIGTKHVIPALQQGSNLEVTAIASRDAATAEAVATRFGIPTSHSTYDDLLGDTDVDAVYIPLPNHLHAEWTIKAAEAGKHVLCEKPLALSAGQAQEMVEACEAAGVKLMEAFMYRLHPTWVQARELIDGGRIGELRAVQSFFSYFNDDPANIRNQLEAGGGALMDVGCYNVNLSRMLFGSEPTSVRATVRRDPVFGTDIVTSAVLGFEGGGQSVFTCSTQLESHQAVHLVGTEGRIQIEIPFNIPADRDTRVLVTSGGNPPVDPNTEVLTFAPANQYTIQGEAFSQAILDDTAVPTDPTDAVANMAVIEAIFARG